MTRQMKDSGIEWIGEIPSSWKLVKYKRFAKSGMGITLLKEEVTDNKTDGSLPVYSATQGDGVFGYTERKDLVLEKNDLVIPARGNSIGNVKLVKRKSTSTQTTIFSKVFSDLIIPKFLKYCTIGLKENWFVFDQTAIPQITVNQINNNLVPTPDVSQQTKIIEILDDKTNKINLLVKETKESIKELKNYKQSLITEAVTKGLNPHVEMKDSGIEWIGKIPRHWEVFSPFRVLKVIRGNTSFKKDDMKPSGDYVAVQYGQIYQLKEVSEEYDKYIDAEFYKEDQEVLYGDTILVSTSETIEDLGHSCYYNRRDTGLLGGEQLLLRPKSSNIHHKFLFYASTYFQNDLKKFATGIKVYRFNIGDLKKIRMVIPPIKEQKEILRKLDKEINTINKLIEDKQKVIEELESYKKSLIYEYVTGKQSV